MVSARPSACVHFARKRYTDPSEPCDGPRVTAARQIPLALPQSARPCERRLGAMSISRLLIIFGLSLVALGLLWPVINKIGLGRLPGDIVIERDNFRVY